MYKRQILDGLPWTNNKFLSPAFIVSDEGNPLRYDLFSALNSLTVQGKENLFIAVSLI